jgi:hypothetical protein
VIEKWLLLNDDYSSNTTPFISNLERIRKTMDTVFGKNYVPAFPPYLLAILQASESGTDLDLRANTHGYFYELFIKQSLAKYASTSAMVNILIGYLSHVSYYMFQQGAMDVEDAKLKKLHTHLHERFEVLPTFDQLVQQLDKMQMLIKNGDIYRFKHPYTYYYFLAYYLSNHLNDSDVSSSIARMARELYVEKNASTLLFLSHLSKDSRILETLLAVCDDQYQDSTKVTLDDDVKFLNDLDGEVRKLVLEAATPSEYRQKEMERLDSCRQNEIAYEEKNRKELESHDTLLGKLNAALIAC